jgi:nitroreductase
VRIKRGNREVGMMQELVTRSRSYRRFQQEKPISRETLMELVELARLSPSAGNKQPLKYVLSFTPARNEIICACLTWAAYLKDWKGPAEGEKPAAYILILGDNEIAETIPWDHGIAAQTMALGAAEKDLRGCILASIDREKLREGLKIPPRYQILLVLALGYPNETIILEEMKGGDVKYWRDEKDFHHVPKRALKELIVEP